MNRERWAHLFTDPEHNPPWHMDWRHVCMIHAVLCAEKPAHVVEIGTYRGASTTAIIEAMEAIAEIRQALLVDYNHRIISETYASVKDRIWEFYGDSSQLYDNHKAEFWLIDGDHRRGGAWQDLQTALRNGAQIIAVHDTNTAALGVPGHEGAAEIADYLRRNAERIWEDCEVRPNELTHRGLLVAWLRQPALDVITRLDALALDS